MLLGQVSPSSLLHWDRTRTPPKKNWDSSHDSCGRSRHLLTERPYVRSCTCGFPYDSVNQEKLLPRVETLRTVCVHMLHCLPSLTRVCVQSFTRHKPWPQEEPKPCKRIRGKRGGQKQQSDNSCPACSWPWMNRPTGLSLLRGCR